MARNKTKKALIIEFHALLRQTKQTENKEVMVLSFGVTSTKDLNKEQLETLISRLRALIPEDADPPRALRRARSTVIGLLDKLGKTDWNARNAYLQNPRIFGKRLNQTNDIEETKALARKLRAILRKQQELAEAENFIASRN